MGSLHLEEGVPGVVELQAGLPYGLRVSSLVSTVTMAALVQGQGFELLPVCS